jgi:hypothetical protein
MLFVFRRVLFLAFTLVVALMVLETTSLRGRLGLTKRSAPAVQGGGRPTTTSAAGTTARRAPAGLRFLIWALFVLLAPVVTAPLAGRVLKKQSNAANAVLLFGYTGLDVLAAHVVLGVRVASIWTALAYLVGLLGVFTYNLWTCAFLAKLSNA